MPRSTETHNPRLAKRIQELRKEHGLNKRTLSKRIGVSDVCVNYWESGESKTISHINLIKLAKFFGITVSELVEDPMLAEHDARIAAKERERCARLCELADKSMSPADLAERIRREE